MNHMEQVLGEKKAAGHKIELPPISWTPRNGRFFLCARTLG